MIAIAVTKTMIQVSDNDVICAGNTRKNIIKAVITTDSIFTGILKVLPTRYDKNIATDKAVETDISCSKNVYGIILNNPKT